MSSSNLSWATSFSCSSSVVQHSDHQTSFSAILQWLRFIFLSPCPQRAIFSSVDLIFLLILIAFVIQKLCSRTHSNDRNNISHLRTSLCYNVTLFLSALLAITYTVLSVLAFTKVAQSSWELVEAIFRLIQAITHIAITILIAHEKRFKAVTHPVTLRVYWIVNFVVVALFSASAIIRLSSVEEKNDLDLNVDDIFSLLFLPVSLYLLVVAVRGFSGITMISTPELEEESELVLKEPLLMSNKANVAGYASATLISRAMWLWLNPLLEKGYKSPLKIDDIASLAPDHEAEVISKLFESNWPKPSENSKHPVRTTLLRCFWKDFVFTAFLAVVRLSVMYMGPVLLQGFVAFSSGKGNSPYEGFYLVAALLLAKIIEVLSSHQFNFQSQTVGMLIRSALITALYKKGLTLSSSSRQAHGLGQIVNYMAVDAQQLSDMVLQLHNLWLMPCQILVALGLLYIYIGVSALSALLAIIVIMVFVMLNTGRNNKYQYNLMKMKDSRMKATSEMLNNMRVIKFQAWEEYFYKRVQDFRDAEYNWLSKFMFSISANFVFLWSTPVIVTTLAFGTAMLLGFPLDAGTVFTATSLFKILQEPIWGFPQALISTSQAMISLGRLDGYLMSKELVEGAVEREEGCGEGIAIEVKDGVFAWDDDDGEIVLKKLNLRIKKGELAAIVGTVGSGKSSLLAAILGEMHKISGKVRVCGTTAYVPQTAWIQSGTIQENVLFGMPMDVQKYKEVIRVCSLAMDLEMMEFGDQTEIGERGINLSGGQKQRIQLARAVYQDCDIYLLDDVFSAVDAHTGSELFKVMRDGMIVQSGNYNDLLESGLDFGALVAAHETSMELVDVNDSQKSPKSPISQKPDSPHPQVANGGEKSLGHSKSEKGTSKLVEDEERETGHVSFEVYKTYSTEAYGWWGVVVVLLMSLLWQLSLMSGDYWLAFETGEDRAASFNPSFFIRIYAILAAVSCVLVLIRNIVVTYVGLKTAQVLCKQILHSIIRAPMSFFDTTPSGRILSRASSDQTNVDILLPLFISMTIAMYITVLGIIVVTCQVAWPTIFLIIPLVWFNIWYRGYYLATSRELTRLESITKAPVIHHFSETVAGVMTIRSFKKQAKFWQENLNRLDANLRMNFHNNGANEWFGFRVELIGSFVLCFSALFMVLLPSNVIKPEFVGLSLSYGLSLNGVLFYAVYMSCFVENRMISVERIKQFINIPSEAPWHIEGCIPSPNWPTHGDVDIKDLQVRYRPNTPLILKGITLSIQGGEKIGVVGRTGSGKSTLIQALFRLLEPSGGKIVIDGIDISTLGLHDLRSRFGIIPQEPVLFQGTIRSNIDPTGLYSDEEIWRWLIAETIGVWGRDNFSV
ncbi:hypothetical protein IFM89_029365 [Coptis chinensis]|uniref:Uncharacterized protein n=1 Tax=Coptis chinensis TaxID=261450 RepID=A0A835IQ54_9MAGN|nr:hypothetical protein IFM89_029365 [Coptis chinensis]